MINNLKKGRLWINELPNCPISNDFLLCENINTQCKNKLSEMRLALELSLLKHNSSYGLLGLEFFPNFTGENIVIEVYFSNKKENLFHDTISFNKKTVYVGMLEEYVGAIMKKTVEYVKIGSIPSGKLIYNIGAHCEVRSSQALFSSITEILLNILMINKNNLDERGIEQLIDEFLFNL